MRAVKTGGLKWKREEKEEVKKKDENRSSVYLFSKN
jgi:hypothetical protein